jgi:hypothetical protein
LDIVCSATFFGLIACIFYKLFTSIEFYAGQQQKKRERVWIWIFVTKSFFLIWTLYFARLKQKKGVRMLCQGAVAITSWDHILFLENVAFGQGGHRVAQTGNRAPPSSVQKENNGDQSRPKF